MGRDFAAARPHIYEIEDRDAPRIETPVQARFFPNGDFFAEGIAPGKYYVHNVAAGFTAFSLYAVGIQGAGGGSTPYFAAVSQSLSPRSRGRVPRIGDLIDLELALEEDRPRPIEVLLARDDRIAREIDAGALDDRALVLAWLDRVRPSPESPGRAAEGLLRGIAVLMVGGGLLSGALAIAGWLWGGADRPVNVVQLWPALVGVQLALALLWIAMRLAPRSLARAAQHGVSTWLPAALGALAARLPGPDLRPAWARFRALDRVYAGLRFWRVTSLTQSFAVAFNVGALAALVFIPTVDDPAFGWRSRLLDAGELYAATRAVAAPWAAVWPAARPSRADVDVTEHSSLAPRAEAALPGRSPVWAAWWPFLVASFLFYGLLPRLALWTVAASRTRALLRGIPFDHEGCVRLRERLRRPRVDGRAEGDETSGAHAGGEPAALPGLELPGRVHVVRWAGVPLDDETLALALARAHGVTVEEVASAGALDLGADRDALETLRGARAVLVVVEAWEPPSADYLDFLRKLRGALDERAPLLVLACELGADGRPAAVAPRHLALWRRQLAGLADPWLRVEPFPAEPA